MVSARRDAYELFDLPRLDDPDEHAKLWMLLSADALLGGATDELLRETDSAYNDITDRLYVDYNALRERLIAFSSTFRPMGRSSRLLDGDRSRRRRSSIASCSSPSPSARDLCPDRCSNARRRRATNSIRGRWTQFPRPIPRGRQGQSDLDIWPYNGGLFAEDPVLDALILPDQLAEDVAALGEWDYRSDVPVTVLGHIFEQSITDIEKLARRGRGEEPPKVSKRKREGVVYTPDIVTRFLGRAHHRRHARRALRRALRAARMRRDGDDPGRQAQNAFLARLRSTCCAALTIVDPACGSGAFLVAAFDRLAREYRRSLERLRRRSASRSTSTPSTRS